VTKWSQKKVFLKVKIWLSIDFFSFLNFNFFSEHFVTKEYWGFLNQHKMLDFLTTQYYLFQEKNFQLSEGPFLTFLDIKPQISSVADPNPIQIRTREDPSFFSQNRIQILNFCSWFGFGSGSSNLIRTVLVNNLINKKLVRF
jgi:hypothetical protein